MVNILIFSKNRYTFPKVILCCVLCKSKLLLQQHLPLKNSPNTLCNGEFWFTLFIKYLKSGLTKNNVFGILPLINSASTLLEYYLIYRWTRIEFINNHY